MTQGKSNILSFYIQFCLILVFFLCPASSENNANFPPETSSDQKLIKEREKYSIAGKFLTNSKVRKNSQSSTETSQYTNDSTFRNATAIDVIFMREFLSHLLSMNFTEIKDATLSDTIPSLRSSDEASFRNIPDLSNLMRLDGNNLMGLNNNLMGLSNNKLMGLNNNLMGLNNNKLMELHNNLMGLSNNKLIGLNNNKLMGFDSSKQKGFDSSKLMQQQLPIMLPLDKLYESLFDPLGSIINVQDNPMVKMLETFGVNSPTGSLLNFSPSKLESMSNILSKVVNCLIVKFCLFKSNSKAIEDFFGDLSKGDGLKNLFSNSEFAQFVKQIASAFASTTFVVAKELLKVTDADSFGSSIGSAVKNLIIDFPNQLGSVTREVSSLRNL